MALLLASTLFQHLIDGFHNRDLRHSVGDLARRDGQRIYGTADDVRSAPSAPKVLSIGHPARTAISLDRKAGKGARLFSRLEARVFRPAVATFTGNDAVLPFPLRTSLDRVDAQMDELIYQAFSQTNKGRLTGLKSWHLHSCVS
jgi:hypothetical protein